MTDPILDAARWVLDGAQMICPLVVDPRPSQPPLAVLPRSQLHDICRALIARTEALRELLRAREAWHTTQHDESVGNDVADEVRWNARMEVAERDYDAALSAARAALGDDASERERER